jgi:hypothetical protein
MGFEPIMRVDDLGVRGRAYAQDMLNSAGSLAKLVAASQAPASGSLWTLVPETLDVGSLRRLTDPIDWAGEQANIHNAIRSAILEHLSVPKSWLVVEDRFVAAPNFVSAVPHHFFVGSEVYYFLAGHVEMEDVELVLRHGSRWPSIGLLGVGHLPSEVTREEQVSPSAISALVSHTQQAIVGVFDEESYLFWNLSSQV